MFIGTQEQLDNSLEELGKRNGVTGESICDAARAELATLMAENAKYKQSLMDVNGLINDYIWDDAGFGALHDAVNNIDEVLA